MNILFLDAYFEPEITAFTHLERDLLQGLIENGHKVQVVCPVPTRGITKEIRDRYRHCKQEKLFEGKVEVTRFWAPSEGKNVLIRALRYLWCNIRQYQLGIKQKNVDMVFSVSTPPTQGYIAGRVAKRLRVPFVYNVQDLFPDSLVSTGIAAEGNILWKVGNLIGEKTYHYAQKIVVINETMKNRLVKRGVSAGKISVISNWIDTDEIKPIEKSKNKLFDEFKISKDTYNVVYAGNIGVAQGGEIILDVAEILKDNIKIQFVIFGGGAEYQKFQQSVIKRNLSNVMVNKLLPSNRVSEVYSLGDVALITCKRGAGMSAFPSKTWSIMACGTPIIAAFDKQSDLAKTIKMSNAGVVVEPENATEMANEILLMYKGKRFDNVLIRKYAVENASKKISVKKEVDLLESIYQLL